MNTTTMDRADLSLLKAMDPVVFVRETCASANVPDPWQKMVLRYEGKRLIMNCCRQSGKSTTVARKAYHRAKYIPRSLILLVSPALRQSSELFRKIYEVYQDDWDRLRLLEDSKLFMTMENGSRIVSLPGKEETIRGYSGADLIIIDEASRVLDTTYYTVRPMLATSGGSLILMSTPYGKRGFFFQEWLSSQKPGTQWTPVTITADQCPRITPEFLEDEKNNLSMRYYLQEYFCQFMETEDQLIPYELIQGAISNDVDPFFDDMVDDTLRPFFGGS